MTLEGDAVLEINGRSLSSIIQHQPTDVPQNATESGQLLLERRIHNGVSSTSLHHQPSEITRVVDSLDVNNSSSLPSHDHHGISTMMLPFNIPEVIEIA